MGFQINTEEFEVEENNKKTDINYEMEDAVRKIEFLNDRYEERIKAVGQRKKNLMQRTRVFVIIAMACILLTVLLFFVLNNGTSAFAFGIWLMIFLVITALILMVNAARAVWSYCIHTGLILNSSIYTLQMEEQDIRRYQSQLAAGKEQLEQFLEREHRDEEAGRRLLEELAPQLKEQECHADYLYGEIS